MVDDKLIEEFRNGDEEAFAKIYEHYAESLIAYGANRVESIEEAHDIIHDLFVNLWEKRASLTIQQSLKAYLFTALHRRIINHYRKNTYRAVYAEQLQRMEHQYLQGPDKELEAKEMRALVESAVDTMPAKMREIYRLSRDEHLTIKQIAEKLNIAEQTVKNQLHRAITIIRARMKYLIHIMLFALSYLLIK